MTKMLYLPRTIPNKRRFQDLISFSTSGEIFLKPAPRLGIPSAPSSYGYTRCHKFMDQVQNALGSTLGAPYQI